MNPEGKELRLAMLGMIEGNGHPYSWSAIINGFNPEAMAQCPYPAILSYLGKQRVEDVRVPGARVTHLWTDDAADAPKVAAASLIAHTVAKPEDVIGQVDAVIISTDDGDDHIRRVRPFIEAGLPVFVDKPMATNIADLRQFVQWHEAGSTILSTSGMRYAPEMRLNTEQQELVGDMRWITSFTCKTWERYGIHALEAVEPLLGPGFLTVQAHSDAGGDVMHLTHRCGVRVTIGALHDAYGSFGAVHLYGTKGQLPLRLTDTYSAFRGQLVAFIDMLRTGARPLPFEETVELMAVIIAGRRSREQNGAAIHISDILSETHS
ncbi:Gfo/Idh/MocA family protein [Prosthecobacter vanneervenii]|uniref:Putative dehydrogenase n=1 Tax=Prosthecobacter vanneervenii TaxID=48466 RepID=A0A7W8DI08_9BACT|nr:Gfo/Idh/MocA family oxidoreductase [Prosthecobacter vanneervenii]MBB5030664.1 putative dehydrogenase [Prosthecobacter vanneervenii]